MLQLEKAHALVLLPDMARIELPCPELPEVVLQAINAVIAHESAGKQVLEILPAPLLFTPSRLHESAPFSQPPLSSFLRGFLSRILCPCPLPFVTTPSAHPGISPSLLTRRS